jgi:quercetin dioxygenase-like cupin family protein
MTRNIAVLLLLCLFPFAASSEDVAVVFAVDDPALEWQPCMDFLPEGCELTVLNGDPAEPNADIFIRFPANSVIARHRHTSAERMVLVAGELHVTYDGHDTEVMKAGHYAYGPAGVPHTAFCAVGDDCVLFIAFNEAVDAEPVLTTRTP